MARPFGLSPAAFSRSGPLVLHAAIITSAILAGPSFLGILWALDWRADRARKREQVLLEDAETVEQMRLAA